MAYQIVWTPTAKDDFKKIVDYLYENWSLKVAEEFVDKTLRFVRRILISKHNGLFYRIAGDEIILLNILSLSQNPEDIPY